MAAFESQGGSGGVIPITLVAFQALIAAGTVKESWYLITDASFATEGITTPVRIWGGNITNDNQHDITGHVSMTVPDWSNTGNYSQLNTLTGIGSFLGPWNIGLTPVFYDTAQSVIDSKYYLNISGTNGATDPSTDPTNWSLVNLSGSNDTPWLNIAESFIVDYTATGNSFIIFSNVFDGSGWNGVVLADDGSHLLVYSTTAGLLPQVGNTIDDGAGATGTITAVAGTQVPLNSVVIYNNKHYAVVDDTQYDGTPPDVNTTSYLQLPFDLTGGMVITDNDCMYDVVNDHLMQVSDILGNVVTYGSVFTFQWNRPNCHDVKLYGSCSFDNMNSRTAFRNGTARNSNITTFNAGWNLFVNNNPRVDDFTFISSSIVFDWSNARGSDWELSNNNADFSYSGYLFCYEWFNLHLKDGIMYASGSEMNMSGVHETNTVHDLTNSTPSNITLLKSFNSVIHQINNGGAAVLENSTFENCTVSMNYMTGTVNGYMPQSGTTTNLDFNAGTILNCTASNGSQATLSRDKTKSLTNCNFRGFQPFIPSHLSFTGKEISTQILSSFDSDLVSTVIQYVPYDPLSITGGIFELGDTIAFVTKTGAAYGILIWDDGSNFWMTNMVHNVPDYDPTPGNAINNSIFNATTSASAQISGPWTKEPLMIFDAEIDYSSLVTNMVRVDYNTLVGGVIVIGDIIEESGAALWQAEVVTNNGATLTLKNVVGTINNGDAFWVQSNHAITAIISSVTTPVPFIPGEIVQDNLGNNYIIKQDDGAMLVVQNPSGLSAIGTSITGQTSLATATVDGSRGNDRSKYAGIINLTSLNGFESVPYIRFTNGPGAGNWEIKVRPKPVAPLNGMLISINTYNYGSLSANGSIFMTNPMTRDVTLFGVIGGPAQADNWDYLIVKPSSGQAIEVALRQTPII